MPNILSEPGLPNPASRSSQVLTNVCVEPLSDVVLEAKAYAESNTHDPEAWIKYGRALRRQAMHRQSIEAYSVGLSYHPFYPLLYRHKGHAYINIGEYDMSASMFEISLRLDPTNWDCWYHQGVAYYLGERYELAIPKFLKALEIGQDNFDDVVACKDWLWLCYTHLGRMAEAKAMVADVPTGRETTYSDGYYHRVLVYAGKLDADEVVAKANDSDAHMYATACYGLSWYYQVHGEKEKAHAILKQIMDNTNEAWGGFAEHAGRRDFWNWKD